MNKILEFKDQYSFLSNFYPSSIEEDGYNYPTVEHYFQSKKAVQSWEARQIRRASSPGSAKRLGRRCCLRNNWENVKDSIMETALRLKFDQNDILRASLITTGSDELIEGNSWGDVYWGVDIHLGDGLNRLGQLLMQIRDEYLEGDK